jgi:hypothetical protein
MYRFVLISAHEYTGGGVTSRGRGGGRGAPRGAPRGRGGRGGARGGRGGGASRVILEPHRHPGVFIAKGKEQLLVTRNLVPGESVYGEKRVSIESEGSEGDKVKVEYRVWNPFRSKLAAAVLGGVDDIHVAPGKKVLYLGAASGTSVSHVADVVGPVRHFCVLCIPRLSWLNRVTRRERSMLSNSPTGLAEISLTWLKSGQTSSVSGACSRPCYFVLIAGPLQQSSRTHGTRNATA